MIYNICVCAHLVWLRRFTFGLGRCDHSTVWKGSTVDVSAAKPCGWGDRCKRQRSHNVQCKRQGSLDHLQRAADFEMRFRKILRQAAPIFVVRVWFTWCLILLRGICVVLWCLFVESSSAWIIRIWQLWNKSFLGNSCLNWCLYYVPGTCLSSIFGVEPPKTRPNFQSKQGAPFGFQVVILLVMEKSIS